MNNTSQQEQKHVIDTVATTLIIGGKNMHLLSYHKTLLTLLAVLLIWPLAGQAADAFPAKQHFAGNDLLLNGKGTRTKLFFNLYNAGLYLSAKNNDANSILADNQPQALRLQITSGQITSQKMEAAVREGFQKSAGANLANLQARIEQLIAVFKESIQQGDIYDFVYRPQTLVIIKNGRQAAAIPGVDFKQAFLGIWLGNHPTQSSLKAALLGQGR